MPDQITNARIGKFARDILVAHILGQESPPDGDCPEIVHHGVFVTIRTSARLRGCIGTFRAEDALAATLRRTVIESAQDSRFTGTPLSARDVSLLKLDISLLSALARIEDPGAIEIGRHGIVIECSHQRGCFLPEVAVEHGWDAQNLLRQCCAQKMGLGPEAWNDSDARLFVFSVEKIVA